MTERALITGITGMAESHLADFLLERTDWDLFGLCRWRNPLNNVQHLLDRVNRDDQLSFVYGDLGDAGSLYAAVQRSQPDYVLPAGAA